MLLRRGTNAVIGCKVHSFGMPAGFFYCCSPSACLGIKSVLVLCLSGFRQRRAYSAFCAPEKGGALPPAFLRCGLMPARL
jgi:hypothetical protein